MAELAEALGRCVIVIEVSGEFIPGGEQIWEVVPRLARTRSGAQIPHFAPTSRGPSSVTNCLHLNFSSNRRGIYTRVCPGQACRARLRAPARR
jgi:hypothetical protein